MRERLLGRRNFREIVTSLKNRIFCSPVAPPEPPEASADDRRMWEILNVVPIVEVNSLTPSERAEFERKSAEKLRAEMEFQTSLNQTAEEFFGDKPK